MLRERCSSEEIFGIGRNPRASLRKISYQPNASLNNKYRRSKKTVNIHRPSICVVSPHQSLQLELGETHN